MTMGQESAGRAAGVGTGVLDTRPCREDRSPRPRGRLPEQPTRSILAMSIPTGTNAHALKRGDILPGKEGTTYRILELLGEGGFSLVYKAECEQTKVSYAVKTLQVRHKASEKAKTRQRREAKTLYELRHPNVVGVHHIGVREEDGLI